MADNPFVNICVQGLTNRTRMKMQFECIQRMVVNVGQLNFPSIPKIFITLCFGHKAKHNKNFKTCQEWNRLSNCTTVKILAMPFQ